MEPTGDHGFTEGLVDVDALTTFAVHEALEAELILAARGVVHCTGGVDVFEVGTLAWDGGAISLLEAPFVKGKVLGGHGILDFDGVKDGEAAGLCAVPHGTGDVQ